MKTQLLVIGLIFIYSLQVTGQVLRDNMDVQMFGCCSFGKTVKSMMEKHYNLKPVSEKKGHQEYVQFLKRLLSQQRLVSFFLIIMKILKIKILATVLIVLFFIVGTRGSCWQSRVADVAVHVQAICIGNVQTEAGGRIFSSGVCTGSVLQP